MKKFFLVVVTILPTLLAAQNGIVISNFSVSGSTITLDLSWKNTGMPTLWLDSAWVFVDYNNAGAMKRLPLAVGATLTATSAPGVGKVIAIPGNNQGVWVVGNARTAGNFTATVKLPFVGSNVSGACAYASNYPPLGKWNAGVTELTITGTPPYLMTVESGMVTKTVQSGSPFLLPSSYTLISFTDQTGAPGMIHCTPPTAPTMSGGGTQCGGSLNITATAGANGNGIKWTDNASTVSTRSVNVTGIYKAVTTSAVGCTSPEASVAVTINALPTINTQPVAATVCYNEGTELSVNATANTGSLTYQWYKNGASITISGQAATLATGNLAATTPFYVVVGNTAGCSVTSTTVNVTARENFAAGAIATTGQTITMGGAVNTITSSTNAVGGDAPITYEWRYNGAKIDGATAATYTPTLYNSSTGTKTFTRWAHDATCNTAFVQSTGSWVLTVQSVSTCDPSIGVNIGGICWAKANVDAPGVFASAADQYGKYFKWYEAVAYANSGTDNTYNTSYASGATVSSTWTNSSPPCPSGWRVPTYAEFVALCNTGSTWKSSGFAHPGYMFGSNRANCNSLTSLTGACIFLPAAGYRENASTPGEQGSVAAYWSSTNVDSNRAYALAANSTNLYSGQVSKKWSGYSVRCVKN